MKIKRFEDLIAWQKAQDLATFIYQLFGNSPDLGFKRQICNAAVSVSNNIAEGFDRESKATFIHFLKIASGSSSEVKSMLYLAGRLNYLPGYEKDIYIEKCGEVSRIIKGLINSLKQ